jgi:hypothetical protein
MAHPRKSPSDIPRREPERERSPLEREPSSIADDREPRPGPDRITDDDALLDDPDLPSDDDIQDEGLGRSDR